MSRADSMYQTEIDLESRILLADMCSRHPKQLRIEAEKVCHMPIIVGYG